MKQTNFQKNMKKSEQTHYEWLFYAMSFLGLAKIGCKELIDQKYRDRKPLTENLLYDTESRFLLIAIFFNVKHALELFIKGLGVIIDRNYRNIHNLNDLLKDLEIKVKELFKNKKDDKVFQEIEDIKSIVKKYIRLEDYKNELFRYPTNRIEDFNETKVEEVLNDIKEIHKLSFLIKGRVNSTKLAKLGRLGQSYTVGWSEN